MIKIRHRLISWLVIAYVKRWGKLILVYFVMGLFVFFFLRLTVGNLAKNLSPNEQKIGIFGAYSLEELPTFILQKISSGLTSIAKDGTIKPSIASRWKIQNNGKAYIFYLRHDIYFSDGTNFTSDHIQYNFSDLSVIRPNKYTIAYLLKDNYSPFLATVSKPIFKSRLIGVSDYKIKHLKLNGNFVESIDLVSQKGDKLSYQFYPTISSLKIAYSLGEVSKIIELPETKFKNTTFDSFKNSKVKRTVNYNQLVALFYNTSNKVLSSKTLREALSYTIPDNFKQGLRNYGPYPLDFFVSQPITGTHKQDLDHAKLLLEKLKEETQATPKISLTIDVLPKYKRVADEISNIWEKLDINTNVKTVNKVPHSFQIFIGEFNVPQDPDQYMLWHSDQESNITHYANLRVDKLLEDGRKEIDINKRKAIYADFQKFIQSDPPASFLFFPYVYDVERR